ncbi:E3 ubiquitin-protein ligase TRIM11-like [Antechinus flavipes]|uniref:E3 ubiquitin-protein ligase TRIM11-like n=1 Tax=Antechinus flavipes TaxID=38775 RepID=UPI002236310F|nr:E3 ubiquitin-protein ligase TRIM11-like [Antechinus flavipes]
MASTGELLKELQNEITCSICRGYFCEPVTIECGHNFCQACLSSSWRVEALAFSCPECRRVSHHREIPIVNRRLAELTEVGKELSSKLMQSTEGQSQCVTHKKPFKLFCEEDQTALCVTCCETPEHGAHKISPIQEAAHKYKRELQHIRSLLGNHLEEDEQLLAQEEKPAVDWSSLFSSECYKILNLRLKEKNLELPERISQEHKANQDRLSQHMQTLQDLMLELQALAHQPNVDLLQDSKQLLRRAEAVLSQRARAVTPELREYPIPGLIEILNRFRVDLTLDPTSADSCVSISGDLKSAKAEEDWQVETKPPEHFPLHYVFAEQAFSSGSQYWEVDVTQLPQWVLGIYTPYLKSRRRRGKKGTCTSLFLLQCVKKEEDYYLRTYPGPLNHRMKSSLPRVGMYLKYSPGTLGFYNVLQRSLIYKFYSIPFTAPVKPIFSPGPPLPGTKPGPMTVCSVDSHLCACCHSSQ